MSPIYGYEISDRDGWHEVSFVGTNHLITIIVQMIRGFGYTPLSGPDLLTVHLPF